MLLFLGGIIVVAIALGALGGPAVAAPRLPASEPPEAPEPPPPEDQLDLLVRYGTPETAEQLRAQGIDLAALGYRDGSEG